ncbi:MAG TPA: DUF4998 domain-containing protein [Parapedobacter sp.]|uniref:DUF4998 domain-containing protein n=1 Tax=Parapedobacter sp. TaxID=1958893 RepID=UPI002CEEE9C6|nr:DUF4998 domain-containing protein [Parapedobacter sp.]HWK57645.1 DUF4998 domain-containing protein [Parapedobacter sp.]
MKLLPALFLSLGCLPACDEKITEQPDTIVPLPNRVISGQFLPGRQRAKLQWALQEGKKPNKCRIYWKQKADLLDVDIPVGKDTMSIIIDNLDEGDHSFSIIALDAAGLASAPVTLNGKVYGANYEKELKNRHVKNVALVDAKAEATINWGAAPLGMVRTEVNYTDASGNRHELQASLFEINTILLNFSKESTFEYRAVYLPHINAIDTFYTDYDTLAVKPTILPDDETGYAVVRLHADGPGDTYELLNRVLGGTAHEVPDCSHKDFGRHITEEFDNTLNKHVFAFFAHVESDDDRCVNFDRQRTEIKTYGPSPVSVKGLSGDEVLLKWKFKLAQGFQPSSSFTHIHQIKAGDGTNAGAPLITITPRFGNPNKLEIIHTGNTSASTQGKVQVVDLAPFVGTWIEATSKIKYGTNGTYELTMRRVDDGTTLLHYSGDNLDLWRTAATFMRPKWGIYRSLNNKKQLRDEKVLFADFVIGKK